MRLGDYLPTLAHDIAFWLAGVQDPDYPLTQLGDLSLSVSKKLRAAAVIVLLAKTDVDTFFHNLIRSGRTREAYLRRLSDAGVTSDHHQASGRFDPLLDSIAAGEFDLANRIGVLSPQHWMQGHEYEDDFWWSRLLFLLVQDAPQGELERCHLEVERVFSEQPPARLAIGHSLVDRDQNRFDSAFDALLDEHEERIASDKRRGQLEEPEVIALREVSIEGLAILRLADRRGLSTRADYRYCPSIARLPMTKPFPGE